ncbi:MAG: Uma2 family endonuclease [Saprospiraceae bacterium]|nr:Uma2 family endonuclease [Saprospiraceae bacterium]
MKYEFNKGIIEKTEAMKFKEQYITLNLRRFFKKTPAFQADNMLEQELEVWTSANQLRKPDFSYITVEQVAAGARGEEPSPEFVIEVISKTDSIIIVKNKVREYFKAGVKILWHIFPDSETVEIYRSPEDIEVCSGDKICSAEPVVEGFKLKAKDVFVKPE